MAGDQVRVTYVAGVDADRWHLSWSTLDGIMSRMEAESHGAGHEAGVEQISQEA